MTRHRPMTTAAGAAVARAELAAADSPAIEEALRTAFDALLRDQPGALYREGGPVHLTASAFVVDAPAQHVALVWHRKGRFWVQPGGHLEPGETSFEHAARREVAEEVGLAQLERIGPGPAMLHQHALSTAFGACREHWDVQYLLRAPRAAARLRLRASAESPEVVWAPRRPDALPPGTVADVPTTLAALSACLDA